MLRLGLRLSLRTGRESITRLILTALAVTIGVTVLLFTLASFRALQVANSRPCWECTRREDQGSSAARDSESSLLWLYRKDYFKGKDIKRVDLAAKGPQTQSIPAIPHLPGLGEYYVSPALAELLRTSPRDELANRFAGSQVGIIGDAALSSPNDLVAIVGRSHTELADVPQAFAVNRIETAPESQYYTNFLKFAFAIGAVGLLFPMLILIATATRLSASRREERYAALRLVGATPRQVAVIASVDAGIGALIGTILGIGVFQLLRPVVADAAITGVPFFVKDLTPTAIGFVAVFVGVPLAAVGAAIFSLKRVQISPLGVSRKVTPKPPGKWRIIPFLLGLTLFALAAALSGDEISGPSGAGLGAGFLLIMVGLLTGGPWLTMQATRFVARTAKGASSLLASRRLADNPKAAFRSVSGLVLGVFVGSVFSGIAPVILAEQRTVQVDTLSNVLTAGFYDPNRDAREGVNDGLSPEDGTKLISQLRAYGEVETFPIYAVPVAEASSSKADARAAVLEGDSAADPRKGYIACQSLERLSVLGHCAGGATVTTIPTTPLVIDHETGVIDQTSADVQTDELAELPLQALLVKADNASSLEKVRTLLARNAVSVEIPKSFGEIRLNELRTVTILQRIVYVAIALTLLIAGCSLAVAVGGSLLERKRPFSLLRLSGMPLSALNKVVLLESAIPLVLVALIAAVSGLGLAAVMAKTLAPAGTALELPSTGYYLTMSACLVASLLVVSATLPLLGRITKPDNARFE